jgi:hypothetical protein
MSVAPYEKSDLSVKGIVWFTVVLAVTIAFGMWLMVWLFGVFDERDAELERAVPRATRVEVQGPQHPPEPVIQGAPGSKFELQHPAVEMEAWRETEERLLTTSGWADRNARTVRIPIERAKQLMLERGFPVRGAGDDASAQPPTTTGGTP